MRARQAADVFGGTDLLDQLGERRRWDAHRGKRKGRGIDDHYRRAGSELKDETPPNTPGFQ